MRLARRDLLLAAAAAALPAGPAVAETSELRALLSRGLDRGYPGMAMLVEGPAGRFSAAVGFANLERHEPMRPDTGFQICSITKTFTAAAALRLADQGRLRLDQTLLETLGEAASRVPNAERIKVSQLLDHSSGIYPTNNDPDYVAELVGAKADLKRTWTLKEMVALADKDRQKPVAEPGSGHHYSDTNYLLLGMIIEKLTGERHAAHIRRTIFVPLRMSSTFFFSDLVRAGQPWPSNAAQGYLLNTKDIRDAIAISPLFKPVPGVHRREGDLLNTTLAGERLDAAAGIVSTLPDMDRFASALFRGRLLSPTSQNFLMAAGSDPDSLPIGKHRVWTLQSTRLATGMVVYKEGDGPGGFGTIMAYWPRTDTIYIGFTNSFGHFDEVDFMLDEVISKMIAAA